MGTKRLIEIIDNYDFYRNLLETRKSVFSEIIEINSTGNNAQTLEKIEPVIHPSTNDEMVLIVDVKLKNHKFFQFKLRYQPFIKPPFFRFDSDGDAHRNKIDGIPLSQQVVPTPHFHKFHESGIEIAYKTEMLLDEEQCKALEDINACLAHFFNECNLRLRDEDFPEIKIMANTLGLNLVNEDPNANMYFE